MKRPPLSNVLITQLLFGAAGWLPAAACAEPIPLPAVLGNAAEPAYRLPPSVMVEPPSLPPVGGMSNSDATCPAYGPAPACPTGPIGRWYHCRAKPALQESHWGYPEQFCIRPFGSYMRAAVVAQVQNGIAAQLALYQMDFVTPDGLPGVQLNAKGLRRLEKISELIPLSLCPLVIEVNEVDPTLNAARRAHVIALLEQSFGEFPDERVVVGRPTARGLTAPEAIMIQENVLLQMRSGASNSFSGAISSGTPAGMGSSGAGGGAAPLPGTPGY
jgi:hypothetical protein